MALVPVFLLALRCEERAVFVYSGISEDPPCTRKPTSNLPLLVEDVVCADRHHRATEVMLWNEQPTQIRKIDNVSRKAEL